MDQPLTDNNLTPVTDEMILRSFYEQKPLRRSKIRLFRLHLYYLLV